MRSLLLLLGLCAATACSSSAGAPDAYAGLTYNCAADARAETYVAGDEHQGLQGMMDVKLRSATPAPPARGDNSWVVEIDSMSNGVVGASMPGLASDITVTPFMPDHMHGSPILVQVTALDGQAGQYTLSPVNLWMPGYWETTISVKQGSMTDDVVYKFCLSE